VKHNLMVQDSLMVIASDKCPFPYNSPSTTLFYKINVKSKY